MTDYILEGWGNKDLWILSNATWVIFGGYDCLKTGDDISGGYGEREFTNILNKDWEFKIASSTTIIPVGIKRGLDNQFFLENDPKPIIFRLCYEDPSFEYKTFYIIYDNIIRDQITIPRDEPGYTGEVRRVGSIYYYTSYNLAFDYGSTVKPVKLKLATSENNYLTHWYSLSWYYIEPIELEDYAFIV